jgi:hypothetical protein
VKKTRQNERFEPRFWFDQYRKGSSPGACKLASDENEEAALRIVEYMKGPG